jgi:hypothetical protein
MEILLWRAPEWERPLCVGKRKAARKGRRGEERK